MTLILKSPAKINLFLRILHRRTDGYHELASLFQAINLFDTLHFAPALTDAFNCSDSSLPIDQNNLVNKAVKLFRRKTGVSQPLNIHLEKNIPQQAGLGGGSSNAATTLWAYNQLSGNLAADEELAEWGAEIGSDIPFFFSQGTAFCSGRGEIVRHLNPLKPVDLLIAKPPQGLSTPLVYSKLNPSLLPQRDPAAVLNGFINHMPLYFNDLETPAFEVLPALAKLKAELVARGFSSVLMSGSGSSFFCIGDGKLPDSPNLLSYQARFTNRLATGWYG